MSCFCHTSVVCQLKEVICLSSVDLNDKMLCTTKETSKLIPWAVFVLSAFPSSSRFAHVPGTKRADRKSQALDSFRSFGSNQDQRLTRQKFQAVILMSCQGFQFIFKKIILVPQTVTRSVVQETFLPLPAPLFRSGSQSAKEIHEEDVLSMSISRDTFEFSE